MTFSSPICPALVFDSFNSYDCATPDPILKKGTDLVFTCHIPGNSARVATINVTAAMIATSSSVTAGSFTSAAIIGVVYRHSDDSGASSWPQDNIYSGSAQGTIVTSTCSVLSSFVNVSMPKVASSAFQGEIGTVSGNTPFKLQYLCKSGTQLFITLTDNVSPINRTDTLTLTPDSRASGASVQISNGAGPISFGPDSAEVGTVNQWNLGPSPTGMLDIPLYARYIRTGTIVPGTVRALATITMSYQ